MERKIVKIDFTAKELGGGTVFDTTSRETAERENIFRPEHSYGPMTVILGKGEMHKALEDEIKRMGVGEQKKIVLGPEKAFGERKAQSIVVMPLQNFKENKMMPYPGMVFEANGMQGRVQSVSGGRVRVDFNHPLAGKTLEYEIKLAGEIIGKKEAVAALYEKFLPIGSPEDRKFELNGGELAVWVPKQLDLKEAEPFKKVIEKIMVDNIEGVKKVVFIENAEAKNASEKEEKTAQAETRPKEKESEKELRERKAPARQKQQEIRSNAKGLMQRKGKQLR